MTNETRADRAYRAILMAKELYDNQPIETVTTDLMVDLLHLCEQYGTDPKQLLVMVEAHHNAETGGDDDQEPETDWLPMPCTGVFATVDQDNNILYCAMLADGSMELDANGDPDPCLVDCVEGDEQEFLDKINAHFGTAFKASDIFGM